MAFHMTDVVPRGRSFSAYVAMSALSDEDLAKPILGCGDGPAGFNAESTRMGGTVVSVDPLYPYGVDDIEKRIAETFDPVIRETQKNAHEFMWNSIRSVDDLGKPLMKTDMLRHRRPI